MTGRDLLPARHYRVAMRDSIRGGWLDVGTIQAATARRAAVLFVGTQEYGPRALIRATGPRRFGRRRTRFYRPVRVADGRYDVCSRPNGTRYRLQQVSP